MGCCSSAKAKGDEPNTSPPILEKPKEASKAEKKEERQSEAKVEQKDEVLNTEQQVVETIQADVDGEEVAVSKTKKKKKGKKKKRADGARESAEFVASSNENAIGTEVLAAEKQVEAILELVE